ncbi:hypothetical protein L228DRAFT_240435 [Xylona heveae TC161]|uniref:Integrase zinc-binding domain-containing protein n=1 Tax=Xylona heveae (strain CBS 132557 / TC161) TaxID=1328760 RepID=A0A165F7B2_XYLHT|nr:hypothetical protein L228DRAFT_240435 [Xylona heveae TC161]KZF20664.1 hypothetical protein L228DRAFT_240435 [Xylona heveae TC161]
MNLLRERIRNDEASNVLGQVKNARLSAVEFPSVDLRHHQQRDFHHSQFISNPASATTHLYGQGQYTASDEVYPILGQQHYMQSAYPAPSLSASLISPPSQPLSSGSQILSEIPGPSSFSRDRTGDASALTFPHGKSLPVIPQPEGFPSLESFEMVMNDYILSLSPKKRDKALIPKKRCDNIEAVLSDPKCTTIESAQFRFWAKKMFSLRTVYDPQKAVLVCHEGKPVAVRERLFQILTKAHADCQHGGRDKTSGQVRRYYSWVPKELIARFVRSCPTCSMRRNPVGYDLISQSMPKSLSSAAQATPPGSTATSPIGYHAHQLSPPAHVLHSPPESRRTSLVAPANCPSLTPAGLVTPSISSTILVGGSIPPTPVSMTPVTAASQIGSSHGLVGLSGCCTHPILTIAPFSVTIILDRIVLHQLDYVLP